METEVALGLIVHADIPAGGDIEVVIQPEGMPDCSLPAAGIFLGDQLAPGAVEAGMRNREDETAVGFEQLRDGPEQRFDRDHVRQRHIADDGVEAALAERKQLAFDRCIDDTIVDFRSAGLSCPGAADECLGKVAGNNMDTAGRKMPGKRPVATGDVENVLPCFRAQQPFHRWRDKPRVQFITVADSLVPECGIVLPNLSRPMNETAAGSPVSHRVALVCDRFDPDMRSPVMVT